MDQENPDPELLIVENPDRIIHDLRVQANRRLHDDDMNESDSDSPHEDDLDEPEEGHLGYSPLENGVAIRIEDLEHRPRMHLDHVRRLFKDDEVTEDRVRWCQQRFNQPYLTDCTLPS